MTTYQELIAQKAELDRLQADLEKQIAETLRNERASVISQIKSLMAENGITAADLHAVQKRVAEKAWRVLWIADEQHPRPRGVESPGRRGRGRDGRRRVSRSSHRRRNETSEN